MRGKAREREREGEEEGEGEGERGDRPVVGVHADQQQMRHLAPLMVKLRPVNF